MENYRGAQLYCGWPGPKYSPHKALLVLRDVTPSSKSKMEQWSELGVNDYNRQHIESIRDTSDCEWRWINSGLYTQAFIISLKISGGKRSEVGSFCLRSSQDLGSFFISASLSLAFDYCLYVYHFMVNKIATKLQALHLCVCVRTCRFRTLTYIISCLPPL